MQHADGALCKGPVCVLHQCEVQHTDVGHSARGQCVCYISVKCSMRPGHPARGQCVCYINVKCSIQVGHSARSNVCAQRKCSMWMGHSARERCGSSTSENAEVRFCISAHPNRWWLSNLYMLPICKPSLACRCLGIPCMLLPMLPNSREARPHGCRLVGVQFKGNTLLLDSTTQIWKALSLDLAPACAPSSLSHSPDWSCGVTRVKQTQALSYSAGVRTRQATKMQGKGIARMMSYKHMNGSAELSVPEAASTMHGTCAPCVLWCFPWLIYFCMPGSFTIKYGV